MDRRPWLYSFVVGAFLALSFVIADLVQGRSIIWEAVLVGGPFAVLGFRVYLLFKHRRKRRKVSDVAS